ncbi:MAG TPA: PAS domain S-box protein [Pyrinomonadaceae bacterium]
MTDIADSGRQQAAPQMRARPTPASALRRYGLAAGSVAAATLLMFALYYVVGLARGSVPFIFYFGAVILSARYAGRGPTLLTILLSALAADYFFIPPFNSFSPNAESVIQVGVFALVSLFIAHVTSRSVRSEAAAQKSGEELATTLRSIGDAVITTDDAGRVTFMNPVAERVTGWTGAEARGRDLMEVFRIVGEGTREPVENPATRVLREGAVVGLANHTVVVARDGRETPIDDSAAPIRDRAGKVVGVVLVFHDVTERRQAEANIRKSEERLRAVAETAADAIITIDEQSRILYVNPAAGRIFGHAPADILGHNLTMLMPDYLRRAHEAGLGRYVGTGQRHISWEGVELPGLHRDGHEISLEVSFAEFVEDGRRFFTGIARDITERRRAEEAITKLAAIVESSQDAVIGKTLEGTITSWNAAAERLYGYTSAEAVGRHISMAAPPERRDEIDEILSRIRNGAKVEHLETVRVRKDGTRFDVSVTVSPIRNSAGVVTGASTIARDITERTRAEESVRASEESYRALADAMPQIVWTARPDGYYDYYNRRWFEYTGMTMEQTEGWGWQPVLHPDDVELCLRTWSNAVVSGHGYEIEYRFRRASDAQYRWHLGRAEPMRDAEGRILKWFGTATDIHDQKQSADRSRFLAEAGAILASSLDYEATLERLARLTVPALADYCLIDIVDEDNVVARVATSHADPSKEKLIERLRAYPPDLSNDTGVPGVLRTGRPSFVADVTEEVLRSVTRDDAHRELLRQMGLKSYMTVPLVARERIVGALTFASTTDRLRYGPEDLPFAGEVASSAALAIDNARLYRASRDANRSKDEFLATLSHELRTPLTPIIGWTHMMRAGRLPEAEATHGLEVVEKNARSLTRLINDLLDMSSIMSGKMSIERAPVDLRQALAEAIETVRPLAEQRGVRLELAATDDADAPAIISGDRTRLVQIFWNLLSNAVKFSGAGARVSVGCRADNGEAWVEVADEGEGIAPDFLPHVFERFRQADGTTTRAHGGLGIGLALVKSLTEAHGGQITAESRGAGRGSRFVVRLPLLRAPDADDEAPTEGAAGARATASPQPSVPKARVLVIEDSRDTLEMLRVVLSTRGYEVVACESAAEALRLAPAMCFDVIVSDIGLPRVDGYELIGRLRQLAHLSATPAVALTGYASTKDAQAALGAGFDMHVAKPVDPATLVGAVERLLKTRPATVSNSES